MKILILASLVATSVAASVSLQRPGYKTCRDNLNCGSHECCMYIPSISKDEGICRAHGVLGDYCNFQQPRSRHYDFYCPCAGDFECQTVGEINMQNHLLHFNLCYFKDDRENNETHVNPGGKHGNTNEHTPDKHDGNIPEKHDGNTPDKHDGNIPDKHDGNTPDKHDDENTRDKDHKPSDVFDPEDNNDNDMVVPPNIFEPPTDE